MEDGNSSSSYSVAGGQEHQVFLNFRGGDCRKGLADHLYQGLTHAGVRVFRDNEKLHIGREIGDQLMRGIKESAMYIPIFSNNYAESKWCLREFALMMECRKELKRIVLPIFYDVSPDDVQHQRPDTYVKAFAEHVRKVGAETVDKWKDALTQVGSLKGWNLQNEFNGHQGELVNAVVAEVIKRLKKDHIHIQGKFVGLDDKIKQVMQLRGVDARIIGIWGMGGMGKTTLANAIYNKLLDQFDCCGFLESVRDEASTSGGLKTLLEILIRKLSRGERQHIDTVSDGRKQLSERFCAKKVLIFLDDVDKKEHLEALAPVLADSWFAKGSLVIVTTRDKRILVGYSGVKIYPLEGLEKHHALQVFCNCAFQAESPKPQLQTLSEDIVKTTGGLPLALNVIGSSLYAQEEQVWVSTLQKLKLMKLSDDSVKECLRISYEALSNCQKDIFIDIACFYTGEDIRNASYIWEDRLGYSPDCELNVLCSMSLIRIETDFIIWMHDQLRDFGREIVETEASALLGKRTFFWRSDQFKDFLMEHKGSVSSNVEAICLDGAHDDNCVEELFTDDDFRAVPLLRLLKLNGVNVAAPGDFKLLQPNLRWFSWKASSFKDRAPNLNPSNLIVLQLSGNWITSSMQGSTKLKVLYLSDCNYLTQTPDFSPFKKLERLTLEECEHLKVIDSSIGKLESLVYLNLENCPSLEELPDLPVSLVNLAISGTSVISIPEGIKKLKKLQKLSIKDCMRLKSITGLPTNLNELDVDWCKCLEEIQGLAEVLYLTDLRITSCDLLMELPDLSNLDSLKHLVVINCHNMWRLKGIQGLESLEVLNISHCGKIKQLLPNLSNLKCLWEMNANGCWQLQSLEGLDGLEALQELNISHCAEIRLLNLPKFSGLQKLNAHHCRKLRGLEGLDGLEALEELDIGCCQEIKLPNLSKLTRLRKLNAYGCEKLQLLEGLDGLEALEELDIEGCKSIDQLLDLSNLVGLQKLDAFGCEKLQGLEGLDRLKALEELNIGGCKGINQLLPKLSNLARLRKLNAHGCEKLTGFENLDGLEELDIGGHKEIKLLPYLSNLTRLSRLDVSECEKLQNLVGLDGLKRLEELNIAGCKEIKLLPNLSNLRRLQRLDVSECEKLQSLEGLDGLKELEELNIEGCKAIRELPNLSNLKSLQKLNACRCEKLQGLHGLDGLKELDELNIEGCTELEESNMIVLRELNAYGCEELRGLMDLDSGRKFGSE